MASDSVFRISTDIGVFLDCNIPMLQNKKLWDLIDKSISYKQSKGSSIRNEYNRKLKSSDRCRRFCGCIFTIISCLTLLFVLIAVARDEPTLSLLDEVTYWDTDFLNYVELEYKFIRLLRCIAWKLNFLQPPGKENLPNDEYCIIPNPFLEIDNASKRNKCDVCSRFDHILTTRRAAAPSPLPESLVKGFQPVVLRSWGKNVSVSKVQAVLGKYGNFSVYKWLHTNWPDAFYSNLNPVNSIYEFLIADISSLSLNQPNFTISWVSYTYSASFVMRQLFHHPPFVPTGMRTDMEKVLYLHGPLSQPLTLTHPKEGKVHAWYCQGSGERRLVLTPRHPCTSLCHSFTVLLKPGDYIVYNQEVWGAILYKQGVEVSLGMLGYISYY